MAEFNDYGLLLATIINLIVSVVVCIIICCTKKKHPKHYRQRIYNVPEDGTKTGDKVPRDRDPDEYWFPFKPYGVDDMLFRAGGDATFFVTALKYSALLFLAYLPFAIMLIIVDATDDNDRQYHIDNPEVLIVDDEVLEWREGLQQWGIANVSIESARMWAHFVAGMFFTIFCWILAYKLVGVLKTCRQNMTSGKAVVQSCMVLKSDKETVEVDGVDGAQWKAKYLKDDETSCFVAANVPKTEPKKFSALIQKRQKLLDKLELLHLQKSKDGEEPKAFKITKCKKIEAIPATEEELAKVEEKLQPKIDEFPNMKSSKVVFATFDSPTAVQNFAKRAKEDKLGLKLRICPPPEQVMWKHLHKQGIVNFFMHLLVLILWWALLLLYSIPIAFLSNLSNFARIPGIGPAFQALFDLNPQITGLINGYMPIIAVVIFNIVLPIICAALTGIEGPFSVGEFETRCFRKYWGFQVGALVFLQALAGGGVTVIPGLAENATPESVSQLVANIVSPTNAFFLSMVLNGSFMGAWLYLLRPAPLILGWYFGKKAPSDKHRVAAFTPAPWHIWKTYTLWMLIWTICTVFSITIPLLAVLAAFYFPVQYLIAQYLFTEWWPWMKTSQIEIGHTIIQAMLYMLQVQHFGVLGSCAAKTTFAQFGIYWIFPILTVVLQIWVYLKVGRTRKPHQAIEVETQVESAEEEDPEALGQAFQHPYADYKITPTVKEKELEQN
eukprot:TRINITY_DN67307_c3_g5_i2.p1 TRINITY_DN67307_c3_g5~~TRINITY_DN67307_c3_g5_i2.p1  ORF type:complete len:724 (-),score=95.35 TRINITY_DN67307_c3_g5_i2:931-3102(-)